MEVQNICFEYGQNCAPQAWKEVSLSDKHYVVKNRIAKDGNCFCSLVILHRKEKQIRDYLQTELICPLIAGNPYILTLHLRVPQAHFFPIGVAFTSTDPLGKRDSLMQTVPKVSSDTNELKPNKWQKISMPFVANGNEKFLVIGNFTQIPDSIRQQISWDELRYYIDAVSLYAANDGNSTAQPCGGQEALAATKRIKNDKSRHTIFDEQGNPIKKGFKPKIKSTPALPIFSPLRIDTINNEGGSYTTSTENKNLTSISPLPLFTDNNLFVPLLEYPPTAANPDTLLIPGVYFGFDESFIAPKMATLLDSFVPQLLARNVVSITVEGHTDSRGTPEYNLQLSQARARAVAQYLQQRGLPIDKLQITAKGETQPIASNMFEHGRAENRRVILHVFWQ
ncbi:MAG: OmpA family protein [Chitinophagales bacterium]|jgi:outer membrane protein OmpA-like peptidoglycan-associated protein|nr:OmpA family protein [Sphingobacteriales bacterium]MBP9140121.1 OmpA family protein [Chitinophagales bacterium]MDA0198235.1 OmpA family protein [Bacteroidota bacterium]MBK6889982.1 OmpA family protein [Sphingobacteriales bacterium]MBK8678159.1 OmpA family protein [Sphingobacteriales bacterium]